MSRRSSLLSIVVLFLLASSQLRGADATPTPTPRPKPARKLGGGAFGTSAAPTPAAAAGGGSLADVVKKAQDEAPAPPGRRGRGLVITNESLRRSEPSSSEPALTIVGTPTSKPGARATPTPTPAPIPDYRDASGRTEADWRQRAAEAREREERAKADVETARAEVRRLENDFYAWSDGNYRERVIRPAWDQAKERLKTLEAEVGAAREALDTLEEEARKSGTPPGWLR